MDRELDAVDRLLKALADPTRLRMIALLQDAEVCVCHMHDSLKISQPKASRHLAYLRKAGVVRTEKRGQWVYYRLARQPNAVAQTLLDAARHCATHVGAVKRDAKRLETQTGCCVAVADVAGLECCGERPDAR
jgi:ArsR family transcriptional regulator